MIGISNSKNNFSLKIILLAVFINLFLIAVSIPIVVTQTTDVEVYENPGCTGTIINNLNGYWIINDGSSKSKTVYIKNLVNAGTLSITTNGWNPLGHASHFTFDYNPKGTLNSGGCLPATLTLTHDGTDGMTPDFSFNINIGITSVPTITVTSPISTSSWQLGSQQTIRWISSGITGNVKIELYKGTSTTPTRVISSSTANDGTELWIVDSTLTPASDYKIRVTSTSTTSVYDDSDQFTISSVSRSITVSFPNGGESWKQGTTHDITWTSSNAGDTVKIDLFKGNAFSSTIISSTNNDGSYTWAILSTQATGTNYQVKITSTSYTDVSDVSDNYFSIVSTGICSSGTTQQCGGEYCKGEQTCNDGSWSDCTTRAKDCFDETQSPPREIKCCICENNNNPSPVYDETQDLDCPSYDCDPLDTACKDYDDVQQHCIGKDACTASNTDCTDITYNPSTTECNNIYQCSKTGGGDNAYNLGDFKLPSKGYCDGQGICDYAIKGVDACDLEESSTKEGTSLSICVDTQSTCVDTCNDGKNNDNDGCTDLRAQSYGVKGPDSDCGGRETECGDGTDNDCDNLPDGQDPDCYVCTPGDIENCGLPRSSCQGTKTCIAGFWSDCSTRAKDCGTCCTCENNNNPSPLYDETQDLDCPSSDCSRYNEPCKIYNKVQYCKDIGKCASSSLKEDCNSITYKPSTTVCDPKYNCSNTGGGDNTYKVSDFKLPSQGYCDGQGTCDYAIKGVDACNLAENTNKEGTSLSICVDGQSTCVDTCTDRKDNDNDGCTDLSLQSSGRKGPDSDCGGRETECGDTTINGDPVDNDCDGLPNGRDPDCWDCTPETTRECGIGTCQGTQTCKAGFWSDCTTRAKDCGTCCTCENSNNPSPLYDETQDSDCRSYNCDPLESNKPCVDYRNVQYCKGINDCADAVEDCNDFSYRPSTTRCADAYLCSKTGGGDNAYNLGDFKLPSMGYCDSQGNCDYATISGIACNLAKNTPKEGTDLSICVNDQSTCVDTCSDNLDNDNDGCKNTADSDCGGRETSCGDTIDNDCDGLPNGQDPDCWECTPGNTENCGDGYCQGTKTCIAGFWSDCDMRAKDCVDKAQSPQQPVKCCICENNNNPSPLYDETQDLDCISQPHDCDPLELNKPCIDYKDVYYCKGIDICADADSDCNDFSYKPTTTRCADAYLCSKTGGGDNAYNLGDFKLPSQGYCDSQGNCDYATTSGNVCDLEEGSIKEGTSLSVCVDTQSTCVDTCNDGKNNDGDKNNVGGECIDAVDSDCGGRETKGTNCNDGKDNDCDGLLDERDPDCWVCTPDDTENCGIGSCQGTKTCIAGFWSDCTTRAKDCGTCCTCENSNNPSPLYDETQDLDCSRTIICSSKNNIQCKIYNEVQYCKGIGDCADAVEDCNDITYKDINTGCSNSVYSCSKTGGGDNAYKVSDFKLPSQGYCDGQGNCDYATTSRNACNLAKNTAKEGTGLNVCVDGQSDCVNTCSDGKDNDNDGCTDLRAQSYGVKGPDSDCGGTETNCNDGIDNDCDRTCDYIGCRGMLKDPDCVDNTAPGVSVLGSQNEWNNIDAYASVECNDGTTSSGCNPSTYRLKIYSSSQSSCPSDYIQYTESPPYRITSHSWVCAAAKDKAGNIGYSTSIEFKIDKISPEEVSPGITNSPETPQPTQQVTYTATGKDIDSGLKKIEIYVKHSNADFTLLGTPCEFNGEATQQTCSYTDGPYAERTVHSYYAVFYDVVGNIHRTTTKNFYVSTCNEGETAVGGDTFYCKRCEGTLMKNVNDNQPCDYYSNDDTTLQGDIHCLDERASSSKVCDLTCEAGSCSKKVNCVRVKGRCGAVCDSDDDCTCPEDTCIAADNDGLANDWADYPAYTTCSESGTCQLCGRTVTPNDEQRCLINRPYVNIISPLTSEWQKTSFTLIYDAIDDNIDTCNLLIKDRSTGTWANKKTISCGSRQSIQITVGTGGDCDREGTCSIKISAKDKFGYSGYDTGSFSIDWTPPTTRILCNNAPCNPSYSGNVRITLACYPSDCSVYYCSDPPGATGTCTPNRPYEGGFDIGQTGTNYVRYKSVDQAGNEQAGRQAVTIGNASYEHCWVQGLECPSQVYEGSPFNIKYQILGTGVPNIDYYEVQTIEYYEEGHEENLQFKCINDEDGNVNVEGQWNNKDRPLTAPDIPGQTPVTYIYRVKCFASPELSQSNCRKSDDEDINQCSVIIKPPEEPIPGQILLTVNTKINQWCSNNVCRDGVNLQDPNNVLSGVTVIIDEGTNQQQSKTTDASGQITFELTSGQHTIKIDNSAKTRGFSRFLDNSNNFETANNPYEFDINNPKTITAYYRRKTAILYSYNPVVEGFDYDGSYFTGMLVDKDLLNIGDSNLVIMPGQINRNVIISYKGNDGRLVKIGSVDSENTYMGLFNYYKPVNEISTNPSRYTTEYIPDDNNWYYNKTSAELWTTDIDRNGKVNIVDISIVAKVFNSKHSIADVTGPPPYPRPDGKVDNIDQTFCLYYFTNRRYKSECDFDNDNDLDEQDINILNGDLGSVFNLKADLNGDEKINIVDISKVAKDFGKPPYR